MKQDQIKRGLQSVGMACFVKYFPVLSDRAISQSTLVSILCKNEGYTEAASRTRVSKARQLIEDGHARAALYMVVNAEKVDGLTKRGAERLFEELSSPQE